MKRGPGAGFVDAVAVGVRHVAEARSAEADGRDHKIGAAQADLVHDALGHRELPSFVGAASVKRRRAAGKGERARGLGTEEVARAVDQMPVNVANKKSLRQFRRDFAMLRSATTSPWRPDSRRRRASISAPWALLNHYGAEFGIKWSPFPSPLSAQA